MRRAPIRSTSAPAESEPTAIGSVAKNAMRPVRAALPVVERTNHGSAMTATVLPISDTEWAAMSAKKGRRAPVWRDGVMTLHTRLFRHDAGPLLPLPACTMTLAKVRRELVTRSATESL